MTKRTKPIIPEPDYEANDFETANETVAAAKARLHTNQSARVASDRVVLIAHQIADRRVQTLTALRKARELTQVQVAETLGIGQGDVSKLEQRQNLMLQTLARYIEATGGRLRVVAEYGDDRVEIELSELSGTSA